MATLFVLLFSSLLCFVHAQDESCRENQANLTRYGICPGNANVYQCVDPCNRVIIVGRVNCSKAGYCCFRYGKCILKEIPNAKPKATLNLNNIGREFLRNATGEDDPTARSLGIASFPPFTSQQIQTFFPGISLCPKFPESCTFSYASPNDIQPHLNIPYCQRIACKVDNPFLEVDVRQCLTYPGCAFDYELYLYRNTLSQAVLPGVPVCHLAIRNKAFQGFASQYIQRSGFPWNPLLTDCLINKHHDEIFGESRGCAMIRVLEELGHPAKLAGWKSISRRDCILINGCWMNNSCRYPLPHSNIKVKSYKDKAQAFDPIPHGRPTCLSFKASLNKGEFLDAYHTCLAAGCSLDVDRTALLQQIQSIATSYLPPYLQPQYWTMALLGQVRADNWKAIADKLIADNSNTPASILSEILPQNILAGTPVKDGVSLVPFTLALNLSAQSTLRDTFTTFGSFGQFGNFNPPKPSLTGRGTRNRLSPRKLNLGSISSLANNVQSHSALHNLQGLLGGLGTQHISARLYARSFYPCPYKNFYWPGFPPLQGSFEGCCDMPFCFMHRPSIATALSEVASYKTEWTSWGPCSKTCEIGQQTRRRSCVGDLCGKPEEEETQICVRPSCPVLLPWTPFTACSSSCGGGMQTRTRVCVGRGQCTGKTDERRPCNSARCPVIRYGRWSTCSVTCGIGVQRRTVLCDKSQNFKCPDRKFEEKPCERFCGKYRYVDLPCNLVTCHLTRIPRCLTNSKNQGHCPPTSKKPILKKCFAGHCCYAHNLPSLCTPTSGRSSG